jgi:ABC-2 type transport system ATP-binding protein
MQNLVAIEAVSKRYGAVQALHNVSLHICAGERVAFVGANGSGKSTLLRALVGLVRVQGRVLLAGVDVAKAPQIALRQVAYMPQVAPPLEVPVAELTKTILMLRGVPPQRAEVIARQLGVDWDQVKNKPLRDLSGGTKQKILAALALASEAPLLVCDEPTANLDTAAREVFFELVRQRPAGSALVLCSHRRDEVAQLVDRVVELSEGVLLRDGPAGEVLAAASSALWAATAGVQP